LVSLVEINAQKESWNIKPIPDSISEKVTRKSTPETTESKIPTEKQTSIKIK
jgi:hypothetical protein